jgi:preprotein translocase subunit SecY
MRVWLSAGWNRLLVTGLCLVAWRALEQITVVGLTPSTMFYRLQSADSSTLVHAIGNSVPLAGYSIAVMGLQPYVYALIMMTLLGLFSRGRVEEIWSSPEGGLTILRWTRTLTVFLAAVQAYGYTNLWQVDNSLPQMDWSARLLIVLQLTAGTMILLLLGEVIDEFGLGFGNGAILIYALTPMATELHRLAGFVETAPSLETFYRSLAVWIVFSIGIAAATIAVLLAVRRIPQKKTKRAADTSPIELRILMSGILRPPLYAGAILYGPTLAAYYLGASNPQLAQWFYDHLTAYGPNPWTDIGYAALYACLVILFAQGVVLLDFRAAPADLAARIHRLAFIGGTFLAVVVVVVPILEWNASRIAGRVLALSGFDIVLMVTMIVIIFDKLDHRVQQIPRTPLLLSRMP